MKSNSPLWTKHQIPLWNFEGQPANFTWPSEDMVRSMINRIVSRGPSILFPARNFWQENKPRERTPEDDFMDEIHFINMLMSRGNVSVARKYAEDYQTGGPVIKWITLPLRVIMTYSSTEWKRTWNGKLLNRSFFNSFEDEILWMMDRGYNLASANLGGVDVPGNNTFFTCRERGGFPAPDPLIRISGKNLKVRDFEYPIYLKSR